MDQRTGVTMQKKILLPVADSIYSEQAIKYTTYVCSAMNDVTYTLFNVQPLIPEILIQEANAEPAGVAELSEFIRGHVEAARRTLDKHKELMIRLGVDEHSIKTVTRPRQVGVAKDILNHAERGGYDVIVLGRRSLTAAEEFFIGSIASKVIAHALEIPVWVVDGESTSMQMLLAVDGSENSLRVVDHVISLVGNHPEVKLTLFHVQPYLRHHYGIVLEREKPYLQELLQRGDKHSMEIFYKEAYGRLMNAGLQESQIQTKTNTSSFHISTAILDEARQGEYGTVVIGRRGTRKAFFLGGAPMRLVHKISNQALWVIP